MQLLYFIVSLASLVAAQSTTATLESSTTSAALPSISSQTASATLSTTVFTTISTTISSVATASAPAAAQATVAVKPSGRGVYVYLPADPNARTSDSVRSGTSSQGGPVDQTVLSSIATSAGRRNSGGFARGAASAALLTAALLAL